MTITVDQTALTSLIEEAKASGGSEMANYQIFVSDLAVALGDKRPDMAQEENRLNDYVYERAIIFNHPDGRTSTGRIDCYKRGCFILEAKQSAKRRPALDRVMQEQLKLEGIDTTQKSGQAKRGTKSWDKIMIAAKKQAEDYARALPIDHGYPPFLLIVDVGNVIEVFADFSGQGKNYAHFPDRQNYRLSMDDLLDTTVQERLAKIWSEPESLNPAKISAEVTQDIAERLAKIAKRLERRYEAKDIAEFLMRCLFTMFAEDAGDGPPDKKLIPNKGFEKLLEQMVDTPDHFAPALESLWKVMDTGGYAPHLNATLKKFNGSLFKQTKALKLDEDDIRELWLASKKEWKDVEPAIFGTLLERALDAKTRSQLGAHYTPRPYVERLVIPTIIEPLREDWDIVLDRVEDLKSQGQDEAAIQAVRDFHHKLCTTRVLDPACGTGNFLYVSLELMKLLEGEILQALEDLGDDEARLLLDGETVGPKQFYGLEINERAVPIADLVLWIGFLKWQLRTVAVKDIPEPILHAYGTIRHQDALIAYDEKTLATDEQGGLITVWDGVTTKTDPITGEEVPDEKARLETYRYVRPRRTDWPKAEFIVGNPPFIGARRKNARLGPGYVDALRKVYPDNPASSDLVMIWWQRASTFDPIVRRFGFVTTNSIKQTFNRRIVQNALNRPKNCVSLNYAIADHPWADDADSADVRVAMTVGSFNRVKNPKVDLVVSETGRADSLPDVSYRRLGGQINSRLKIGVDIDDAVKLTANDDISHQGMILGGVGFRVSELSPELSQNIEKYKPVLKRHYKGAKFVDARDEIWIFDLFGFDIIEVQRRFPLAYQHVLKKVKPFRDEAADKKSRDQWWIFIAPREELRLLIAQDNFTIATARSATHRLFQFVDTDVIYDDGAVLVGLENSSHLGVLSSRVHCFWTIEQAARLGVGNDVRYNKSETFDMYPFPAHQNDDIASAGGRLDTFRKERLAAHNHLTMTGVYNVLERVRELDDGADVEPLSVSEKDVYEAGQIAILKELHDEIDQAVFGAYGWDDLADRLVGKPGATMPSPHKSEDQEAAEEELLMRLVDLNQQRAADEKRGIVHWLRPDFQIPRLGHKVQGLQQHEADLGDTVLAVEDVKWPTDGLDQIRALRDFLAKAEGPTPVLALSAAFKGRNTSKRRDRIKAVLETLVATGAARSVDGGYFLPR